MSAGSHSATVMAELAALSLADQTVRVAACFRVTIYLDTSDAAAITEYSTAALALLKPHLTFYQTGSMKQPAPIPEHAEDIVGSWFRRPREEQTYWARFNGGGPHGTSAALLELIINYRQDRKLSAEELEIRRKRRQILYGERGWKTMPAVSAITLTLPTDHSGAQPETILSWLLARPLLARTCFASGSAGLGLNHDATVADNTIAARIEERIAYAIARYPGADWQQGAILDRMMLYDPRTRDLVPRIKRVNWLTVVSERGLAFLGPPEDVCARLAASAGVKVHRLAHGVLIQASPEPLLGDANRDDPPEALRHVGAILRTLRLPTLQGIGHGLRDEIAQRWLSAFDQ